MPFLRTARKPEARPEEHGIVYTALSPDDQAYLREAGRAVVAGIGSITGAYQEGIVPLASSTACCRGRR